jgi:hypothetical protein
MRGAMIRGRVLDEEEGYELNEFTGGHIATFKPKCASSLRGQTYVSVRRPDRVS